MRKTNFIVGDQSVGYDTFYNSQFRTFDDPYERTVIDKSKVNELQASHWDHSKSWMQEKRSHNLTSFDDKRDPEQFRKRLHFTY